MPDAAASPVAPSRAMRASRALRDPVLWRFLLTGGANTLLGFVLFRAFLALYGGTRAAPGLAQASSFAIGIALGYLANRAWTFRSAASHRRQLPRYLATYAIALAVSSALLQVGVGVLGLPANACWLVVTAITTALSFSLQRAWVFRAP